MHINHNSLSHMTKEQLVAVIKVATDELARRSGYVDVSIGNSNKAIPTDAPPQNDKDFALGVKALVENGDVIRASDRRRVAELAERFPAWVRRQGMPTEGGDGAWNKYQHRLLVGMARER